MFENFNYCNLFFKKRRYVFLVAVLLVFSLETAFAHKVIIYAWVEGDTVYTQSKFGGGRKVHNSTVVVYDKEGNKLLEGKTDEKGEFSFKAPQKTELKVVLKASMGHGAEWTIRAEDFVSEGNESSGNFSQTVMEESVGKAPENQGGVKNKAVESVPAMLHIERQELQKIIDESLDKKLTPITNMLADSMGQEPGISEILGGIGYIFGLVGVALYFANRRKNG